MPRKPTEPDAAVRAAVDAVLALHDPADRAVAATKVLAAMDESKVKLSASRHDAAVELKPAMTLAQLAELMSVSRSRAQQIVDGLSRSTAARSTPAAKRGRPEA